MNELSEEWKPIIGFSRYEISNYGRVKNVIRDKILTGTIEKSGYIRYMLINDSNRYVGKKAHSLVAKYFIDNDDNRNKVQVNHIDEDKTNPSVRNLEWTTPKENANHGTRNKRIGLQNSKPINEYDLDGKYIRTWISSRYVSKIYPVTDRNIQSAASNDYNNQTAYGRQWKYLTDNNISNISPVKSTHIRKYNKNINFDSFVIPDDYLFTVNSISNKEECLKIICELKNDRAFSMYYINKIEQIQQYILQIN